MSSTTDILNIILRANASDLLANLRNAGSETLRFGETAQNVANKTAELFRGLKTAIGMLGIGKIVKDAESAYIVQMENELKLSTVLKQRTNATEGQIQAIKNLASEQQKIGIIGDEVQLAGAQQIATFVTQTSSIEKLIPAMNNLMAQQDGYNASVSSAVNIGNLMGKVLQGQTSALTRVGITFTQAQESVLKYGTEEERAAMLAEVINSNVGEMNRALRNTPTGAITALKNDFGDMLEEIGATFQPLISTAVPILSQTLQDISPVIKDVSTGITTVLQGLKILEKPAVRGIVYAALAAAAINKLTLSIGGTASGLLLLGTIAAFVIGRLSQTEEEAGAALESGMEGAEDAADGASDSVGELNEEIEKTTSKLASFDKLTKLSGSSGSGSLASKIATSDDLDNIEKTTQAAIDLQDAFDDMGLPELDWDSIKKGAEQVAGDIFTVFTGTEQEQYEALGRLNSYIERIFGPEFTGFWKGIGSDVFDIVNGVLNGDDRSIYKGASELNEKLKAIPFWDSISSAFQKLGQSFEKLVRGIKALAEGDYEGANIAFLEIGSEAPFFSDEQKTALKNASNALINGNDTGANIEFDKFNSEFRQTISGLDIIQGSWWSDHWQQFGGRLERSHDLLWALAGDDVAKQVGALAGDDVAKQGKTIDTERIRSAFDAHSGGERNRFEINMNIDGEPIARYAAESSSNQVNVTNGAY